MIIPAQGGALLFPKEEPRRKKIYLVTCGEYSDYRVIGFCDTEKEARRACEKINKEEMYCDRAEIEECWNACAIIEREICEIQIYEFRFLKSEGRLAYECMSWITDDPSAHFVKAKEENGDILVSVPIVTNKGTMYAKVKAAKIAADAVAKFRAQQLDL